MAVISGSKQKAVAVGSARSIIWNKFVTFPNLCGGEGIGWQSAVISRQEALAVLKKPSRFFLFFPINLEGLGVANKINLKIF